jgi:hypothetical protein
MIRHHNNKKENVSGKKNPRQVSYIKSNSIRIFFFFVKKVLLYKLNLEKLESLLLTKMLLLLFKINKHFTIQVTCKGIVYYDPKSYLYLFLTIQQAYAR